MIAPLVSSNSFFNHFTIEDRFVECALCATQKSFIFEQFTDEQMLEKSESARKNKE
jgi:hypothetical protein